MPNPLPLSVLADKEGSALPSDRAVAATPSSQQAVSPVPASIPSAASFDVGVYSDGSRPVLRVYYDTDGHYATHNVWLESGGDNWVAFDASYASEICATIMSCAQAIEARRAETQGGSVHESAVSEGNAPETSGSHVPKIGEE